MPRGRINHPLTIRLPSRRGSVSLSEYSCSLEEGHGSDRACHPTERSSSHHPGRLLVCDPGLSDRPGRDRGLCERARGRPLSDAVGEFGASLCAGLEAMGVGPSLCADEMGRTALGYSLFLLVAAVMLGLLTIEPATLSTFVRMAIEERAGRRTPPPGSDRTGRSL
jgi:hypothetical protein